MSTFLTRREAKERASNEKAEKRNLKLRFSDLLWASKRRYLDDKEWYDLHKLNEQYGSWGPERSEYEFHQLSELRSYFQRHQIGSKCPHMNALEKHLASHAEKQALDEKEKSKKYVTVHPAKAKK